MSAAATPLPPGGEHEPRQRKTLTPHEVADICGFGVTATYKLLHDGVIPHIRVGNRFYIPRVALDRWLESFEGGARQ